MSQITHKMPKRKCVFNDELKRKYSSFKEGPREWEATCVICNCTISVANKGKSDIDDHIGSKKHQTNLRSVAGTSNCLKSFVTKPDIIKSVAAAEATLSFHTVCHHPVSYTHLYEGNSTVINDNYIDIDDNKHLSLIHILY